MESRTSRKGRVSRKGETGAQPVRLSSIKSSDYSRRISTGMGELDRVLGGGILSGMATLVAGEPGIGKSTLLLQLANNVGGKVVYVAGEESASQIANRAKRLGVRGENIEILEETDADAVLEQVEQVVKVDKGRNARSTFSTPSTFPTCMIVDSIQTLTTQDLAGAAGSVGQVRECASRLVSWAKRTGTPLFLVGHVTKEGQVAGPRVLEHMVDSVLWFEGERQDILRVLRAVKNRFGPTDEVGIFSMEEKGLVEVLNPSALFLGETKNRVPGSAVTAVMEGTRPLAVEIQALVVPTKLAFPKRLGSGVDSRRLEVIVAVLTRRVGLPLWDYDIFVNAAGGIKVSEPAADLAIALALASSFHGKPLAPGALAVGEVGLLGEIREVTYLEKRIKEARRLGFKTPITKKEAKTVGEAIKKHISSS